MPIHTKYQSIQGSCLKGIGAILPIIGIVFLLTPISSFAQTCCSAGAPLSSSFDVAVFDNKSFSFHIDYEYKSINRLVSDNQVLINDPRSRSGSNLLWKTDFTINRQLAITAVLPYVFQHRQTISQEESARGIGDLTIVGQYSNSIANDLSFKINMGIKLPTGKQVSMDDRGIILSPDMQSGSGTYDFVGRFALLKGHLLIPNLTVQSGLTYRYNTTNSHFGDPTNIAGRRFKFGNELQWLIAFNYLIVAQKWFLLPELGMKFRHTAPNKEQGIAAPNSGGNWLSLPIGLVLQPNDKFSIRLYGELPIYQDLKGLQITTDYQLGIQFSYIMPIAS